MIRRKGGPSKYDIPIYENPSNRKFLSWLIPDYTSAHTIFSPYSPKGRSNESKKVCDILVGYINNGSGCKDIVIKLGDNFNYDDVKKFIRGEDINPININDYIERLRELGEEI